MGNSKMSNSKTSDVVFRKPCKIKIKKSKTSSCRNIIKVVGFLDYEMKVFGMVLELTDEPTKTEVDNFFKGDEKYSFVSYCGKYKGYFSRKNMHELLDIIIFDNVKKSPKDPIEK